MDMISLKKSSGGLSAVNFTLGVLNCFFIVYIIGAYPQHLWLVYFIESFYMIPRKFYTMWNNKPLNQALYYLDFCWMMNFMGIFFLALLILSEGAHFNIGEEARQIAFKSSMGVACGVLLSANVALPFVAALFHDVNTMTGLFIHLMPPMVVYTFKWHSEAIVAAWPNVFHFSYIDNLVYYDGMNGIAGCATVLYFTWWISYTSFMLIIGVNLPKKYSSNGERRPKWDTVFHSTMRDGACIVIGKLRGRSKADSLSLMETNMFDLPDFFLYMFAHMTAALGAIYTIGYGCFLNKWFHLAMLGFSVVLAVIRGGQRYTYYSTKMYTRALRKEFSHIIEDDGGKVGYTRLT